MAQKISAAMPDGMDLTGGWTIQWAALDPSTGDAVSGVNVSNILMEVVQVSAGTPSDLVAGPFQLIPLQDLNS
jgi:hypothetical protein